METINYEDFPVLEYGNEVYINFYIGIGAFLIFLCLFRKIYEYEDEIKKHKYRNIIYFLIYLCLSMYLFFVIYICSKIEINTNFNLYLDLIEDIQYCKNDNFYIITNETNNCFNTSIMCSCINEMTCINFNNNNLNCIEKDVIAHYRMNYIDKINTDRYDMIFCIYTMIIFIIPFGFYSIMTTLYLLYIIPTIIICCYKCYYKIKSIIKPTNKVTNETKETKLVKVNKIIKKDKEYTSLPNDDLDI